MINKIIGRFSYDVGVDLGTANTLVYVKGQGIVINEPSVVAANQRTGEILAIGDEAKRMVGKTPANIVAHRPLVDGVVSDFEVTEQMLKHFIHKIQKGSAYRPRVVIGIPSGVTEVEKRAVEEAAAGAGAWRTFLIEEPMAAAIGCRLPIQEASGNMIVDIGGGTTEVAVISLGGIVVSRSVRVAGDELSEDIIQYVRDHFGLHIGERTAENIKIAIGSAYPLELNGNMPVRGRDLVSGLPKEISINSEQVMVAMSRSVAEIVDAIKMTIEETPPELLADIMTSGITLAGGGALLSGLDTLIYRETKMPVRLAEDPLTAVVRGTGLVLEDLNSWENVLLSSQKGIRLKR